MPPQRPRRRLAAVLAADIVGYSRLMELDEAGTLEALKALKRHVLSPSLKKYRGRRANWMGRPSLTLALCLKPRASPHSAASANNSGWSRTVSWRRGRDSNPRKACAFNGFQDRRNRPLCHPSWGSRLTAARPGGQPATRVAISSRLVRESARIRPCRALSSGREMTS
jgi:class 3 adenylate cyclase